MSLNFGVSLSAEGPDEIGLNTAIQLLGLPRKLGFHPETNKTVSAGIGMMKLRLMII